MCSKRDACLGRILRSAYLVKVALVPSISRAEVRADAVFNAKHGAAEGASTPAASGALEELPEELPRFGCCCCACAPQPVPAGTTSRNGASCTPSTAHG
eukprot:1036763-Pelagomonas_calceolata.AAC.4